MRFFKAGKSKNSAIPVILGVVLVIVLVLSVNNAQPKYQNYAPGVWTDGVYTSDFLRLQFTLPEGWTAASQEELDAMMQEAMDQSRADDPETAKGYENGKVKNAYELKATQENGDGMVVVMSQKMKISAKNYLEKLTELYQDRAIAVGLPEWTLGGRVYQGLKLEMDGTVQYVYAFYEEGYFITIQMKGASDNELMALRDAQFADHAAPEE